MRAANSRLKSAQAPPGVRQAGPTRQTWRQHGRCWRDQHGRCRAPIGPGAAAGWEGRRHHEGVGPVAFPRLTSRPLDRRMVLLPSRNSISSTCVLTCPFVGAQSRGSYDFPRVRGPIVPPVLLTRHHSTQPFRCQIAFCARATLRHPVGWAGLASAAISSCSASAGLALGTATTPSTRRRSSPTSAIPTRRAAAPSHVGAALGSGGGESMDAIGRRITPLDQRRRPDRRHLGSAMVPAIRQQGAYRFPKGTGFFLPPRRPEPLSPRQNRAR